MGAGLVGDESLPALDPRRYPIQVKDLRAFAASVLLDNGSSLTEAALLRHSDKKTTDRHYARAMQERAHDRARSDAIIDWGVSLGERLAALWFAWVKALPEVIPKLGMDADNVIDFDERRRST